MPMAWDDKGQYEARQDQELFLISEELLSSLTRDGRIQEVLSRAVL